MAACQRMLMATDTDLTSETGRAGRDEHQHAPDSYYRRRLQSDWPDRFRWLACCAVMLLAPYLTGFWIQDRRVDLRRVPVSLASVMGSGTNSGFWRGFREACYPGVEDDAFAQEGKAGAAVHLAFDHLVSYVESDGKIGDTS